MLRLIGDLVGLSATTTGAMVVGLGTAVISAADKRKALLRLTPLGMALLASRLQQHPFKGQLLLFLVPAIFIIVAAGIVQILQYSGRHSWVMKGVVVLVLLIPSLQASTVHLVGKPMLREEIVPVLGYMQRHRQETDTIYLYYGAVPAFRYYQARYVFEQVALIESISSRSAWKHYLGDLEQLRGRKRAWFVFSHIYRHQGGDEKTYMLNHLNYISTRLDSVKATGAEAHLYDMGETSKLQVLPTNGYPSRSDGAAGCLAAPP